MDYKNKYFKYKNKYLNLKNNIGGINIDKIKRIPGGRRSGFPLKTLIKMVKNKTGIFFLDKADPKNFPKNSILGLKPGYHIHGIFKKGQIWNDNGKKVKHKGSVNMIAFIKIIKDNNGKKWAVYDHNLDPQLDIYLINSFPKN